MISQSLPPVKKTQLPSNREEKPFRLGDYIEKSLNKIDNGCLRNGRLSIDEGYGDYRMSIFRLRDRKRRLTEKTTAFDTNFMKEMSKLDPELQCGLKEIIQCDNDEYLSRKKKEMEEQQALMPSVGRWKSEDEDHLYHRYVSEHEKEKWFKNTIPSARVYPTRKESMVISEPKSTELRNESIQKKRKKSHFFRFLEIPEVK